MKKLFNWIWAKPKKQEVQQTWTIERDGWEQSAAAYNRAHGLPEGVI